MTLLLVTHIHTPTSLLLLTSPPPRLHCLHVCSTIHTSDQIRNVHRNVKQTEAMNRRASYLITGMSSIWGSIRNAFVKPPGLGSADVRSAGGSGGSGGGSTGATAGGSSSRGSAAAGTHGGSSSGSGGAGGSSVWPPAHDFTQEPEPSSSGSASGAGGGAGAVGVTHDQYQREEDAAMQAISKSLGRLKHAGVTVGETLDEHNIMLDDVSHDVDTARLHMRKNERRAKRLL